MKTDRIPTETSHMSGVSEPLALPEEGSSGRRGCGPVVLGVIMVLVGIPMLVCPGPGVATIIAGLGMIGAGLGIKKRDPDLPTDGMHE